MIVPDREIASRFYIDDHAVLYGLMAKGADSLLNEEDRYSAIARATILYAVERGRRMAKRAAEDGLPLTLATYRAYTEWTDEKKQMRVETLALSPNYRMNGTYCVWNETWKAYHLEKYGAIYCSYTDQTMVRAFNPENDLIIHSVQSHGGPGCDFEWPGLSYAGPEELKQAAAEKRARQGRAVKDFLYHCGHVVSAMGRSYAADFGQEMADQIIVQAMAEYAKLFGEDKAAAVIKEAERDFSEV